MKTQLRNFRNAITLFVLSLFIQVTAYAQDGPDLDIKVSKESTIPSLFTSAPFWIGVAIVIVVVALIIGLSGRNKK